MSNARSGQSWRRKKLTPSAKSHSHASTLDSPYTAFNLVLGLPGRQKRYSEPVLAFTPPA
ncbi:hypothetical protein [Scardovia inopinata]|uniref:hypothetical protein n=1 Tax=Scardovia inopinata TaxID=78259 RepID=UPI0005FC4007|nr:hypothetical protein [Scardovia inopinata]BAR06148.1 hypothetical protein SCIP_0081 [Scardovia inopinata JCM 12537]